LRPLLQNRSTKRPGATAFNPLFLYGGYGVGKTHLGHAIGLEVKNAFPDKVVLYLSSEKFIQQFVSAAKAHKQTEFANFYQMVDVLIIDDIQFLSGKKSTQDSFFHIFDYLHQNGKQIILTSDKAPVDIFRHFRTRIVSRFKWGLSAEIKIFRISIPEEKIIVDKLSRDGIVLTEDMLDFLASEVKTNVRRIDWCHHPVIAYSHHL
jgi:chromosomal replication initiator protein DnaA